MKNICYILSGINTALAFEWINELLDHRKFKLHFVLLHHAKGSFEQSLIEKDTPYIRINYRNKKDLPIAIYKTIKYLKNNQIQIVHSHLLDAGIIGSIAAIFSGIKTRIYTRHYSTYHHTFHPKGVYYDRLINALSSKIIAVSKVVEKVLIENEKVNAAKVEIIHHGFPLAQFSAIDPRKLLLMKNKYIGNVKYPVIGVVSRHTQWKGIQYIIPAFAQLLRQYPDAHLVLANAKGEYHATIENLLKQLPARNYTEIVFEEDLFTLFKCFDVFVHTPIDHHSEAFGQVYIEAMASGIPSVFTKSGIGNEIIRHKINAIEVPYCDSQSIESGILTLLQDKQLYNSISAEAKKTVAQEFELNTMIQKLTNLYE